jgi:hypothetical protein
MQLNSRLYVLEGLGPGGIGCYASGQKGHVGRIIVFGISTTILYPLIASNSIIQACPFQNTIEGPLRQVVTRVTGYRHATRLFRIPKLSVAASVHSENEVE